MTDGQSASSCGCVWERSEEHEIIVVSCEAHRAGVSGGEVIGDIEDRVGQILDQELNYLVTAAAKGKRVELIRGPDPTRGR